MGEREKGKRLALLAGGLFLLLVCASVGYRWFSGRYDAGTTAGSVPFAASDAAETVQQTEAVPDAGSVPDTETAPETESNPDAAEPVPDFTMTDRDGGEVRLSDFFGTPVVVNFWASWCPPCKGEMPHFQEAFGAYGGEIAFLMVDLTDGQRETVETAEAFLAENGYTFPAYFDTALEGAYTYGVKSIPMTLFLRADGALSAYQIGALERETLFSQLDALLA